MESKKHFDFLASFVLIALGVYVILAGMGIVKDAGEIFYVSPGFFPVMLGLVLVLCSFLLLASSLKGAGFSQRRKELKVWWQTKVHDPNSIKTLVGIGIMLVYTYGLLRLMPFWLASGIFLVALMLYLRSTSVVRILIISAGSIAAIVVFFQIGFGVPLP